MKYNDVIDRLQNLTMSKINTTELAEIVGVPVRTLYTRSYRNSEISPVEVKKIEEFYNVSLSDMNISNKTNTISLDYFPDVFGSCGNGVFQFSTKKELITIPKSSLFKNLAPGKEYFVINAYGNSMEPFIFDKDKLVVESYNGEQIVDNRPYLFCYKDEIFIKRLAKNVDQLMIIPENKDYDVRKLTGKELEEVNIIGEIVGLMRDLRG